MKKENNNADGGISQLGNVDQIREILFGSQSRELKEKFEKIESSMEQIQSDMRKKIEQTQNDFNKRITSEIEGITRKLKNITTQQQDEFADVRDSAIKQEKRIQNSLEILEEELQAKNEQLQKQQTDANNALRVAMDELQDELLKTINTKLAEMGEVKLARDDAAEILMEAAMAMKGTKINQQLSTVQTETK